MTCVRIDGQGGFPSVDEEKRRAFSTAFRLLRHRISLFTSLPFGKLDQMAIKRELDEIGCLRDKDQ